MPELLGKAPVRTGGIGAVHFGQPRGPLHQGAHGRAIAGHPSASRLPSGQELCGWPPQ